MLTLDEQAALESATRVDKDDDGTRSALAAIEARTQAGCRWAIHDAIVLTVAELAGIADAMAIDCLEGVGVMRRMAELQALKPIYGTESVIDGGRQAGDIVTNQETAASECSGTDRRRIAGCAGRCPRATAGQRAGGGRC